MVVDTGTEGRLHADFAHGVSSSETFTTQNG